MAADVLRLPPGELGRLLREGSIRIVAKGGRKRLIFVSHSSVDTWVARQIAREIEARGAECFLDEAAIEIGADFEEAIRAALERADELVVLLTPWSLERPYVWAELGAAWLRGIPIVGILHGLLPSELQSRPSLPLFLKRRDMPNLNEIDTYLRQVGSRV